MTVDIETSGIREYKNVALQIYLSGAPSVTDAKLARDLIKKISQSTGEVHLFIVASPGLRPPDSQARKLLAAIGDIPNIKSCAFVISGKSGFWRATMRAVFNGMLFVVPPVFEIATFGETVSASKWTEERAALKQGELLSAVDEIMFDLVGVG